MSDGGPGGQAGGGRPDDVELLAQVAARLDAQDARLAVRLDELAATLTGRLRALVDDAAAADTTAARLAELEDRTAQLATATAALERLAAALATRLAGSGGSDPGATRSAATASSGRRVVRRVVAGPDGRRAAVARPVPDAALLARLQQVDGVGPVRAAELVAAFPSARALLAADVGDLAALDGVDPALARRVQEHLRT